MKCPRCGTENRNDDKICKSCGAILPERDPNVNPSDGVRRSQGRMSVRPKSKFVRALLAVLHVLFYISLYYTVQSFVQSMYGTAYILSRGITQIDVSVAEMVNQKISENIVVILLVSNLVTLLIVGLLQTIRKRSVKREIKLEGINLMRIPTFAILGVALNVFTSCTISVLPIAKDLVDSFDSQYASLYKGDNLFMQILSVAIVAGIVEEVIFRGLIITRLERGFGKIAAVIVSALIFGLFHRTPIAIVYATVLGFVFGVMYLVYDSIVPSIVCHVFFNLTSYLMSGYSLPFEVMYVLSAAAILYFGYRAFIRRPTFSDIISDRAGKIKGRNAEESAIFDEIRSLPKRETVTSADVEKLNDEFDRVMAKRKGSRTKQK